MRNLWLFIALLMLVPIVIAPLKFAGGLDWSLVQALWLPILLALLATAAVRFLLRIANWQHGNNRRHH